MEDLLTVPACLPHLKTVTDGGPMLEIFRKYLRSVPGKPGTFAVVKFLKCALIPPRAR